MERDTAAARRCGEARIALALALLCAKAAAQPEERFTSPGGGRAWLEERGFSFELVYAGEVVANLAGGRSRGAELQGVLDLSVAFELEPLTRIEGLRLATNVMATHGTSPSRRVGDDLGVSSHDAFDTVRLQNLWVEQELPGLGLALRVGQQAVDEEFLATESSSLFLHGVALYPFNLSPNAPVWPVAGTAILVRYRPLELATLRAGAFHADPDLFDEGDANRHGLRFGFDGSETFSIGSVRFDTSSLGSRGVVELGGWIDTNDAPDPGGGEHDRSYGVYALFDQRIVPEARDPDQGLNVYARYGQSPDERALLDRDLGAAVVYTGLVPDRDHDRIGLGWFRPRISPRLSDTVPGAETESVVELTYAARVVGGVTLQGGVQYVRHPGGARGADRDDALVVAIRAWLRF